MDPSIIGNVDSLYALLGLGIVAITVLILDQRRRAERTTTVASAEASAGQETTSNGHSVSANYVKRIVAEHERDCKIRDEIEALRNEMRSGFRTVSEDFRGVHERLDRVIERRAG